MNLGPKEWITIHQALVFTAQYSETSGKPKAATDEIKRVRNLIYAIVEGLMREHAVQKRDGTLNKDGTLNDKPQRPIIYSGVVKKA